VPRCLIINADDFGLTEQVSRAIIRAHREGILTSTTFMVNFPWAEQMAPMLQEAPDLGVGIHLNLTTGSPLLPPDQVRSLVNHAGQFSRAVLRLLFRVDLTEARREWSAQVERGIALLGCRPTHLDTHRYLQGYPPFAEVMLEVARAYGIPAVRCLYPDLAARGGVRSWSPTGMLLERYLRRSSALTAGSGLRFPGTTLAGDFDLPALLRKLERVGEGATEIVSHPGVADEHLRALSSLVEQREAELAALTATEARRKVEELGITLISFRHLASDQVQ
jgi:chitin disaccharide deacetylase